MTFSAFKSLWREMKFSFVHLTRSADDDIGLFMRKLYAIVLCAKQSTRHTKVRIANFRTPQSSSRRRMSRRRSGVCLRCIACTTQTRPGILFLSPCQSVSQPPPTLLAVGFLQLWNVGAACAKRKAQNVDREGNYFSLSSLSHTLSDSLSFFSRKCVVLGQVSGGSCERCEARPSH